MTTQTANPLAALADPAGDYELTMHVSLDFQDYARGVGGIAPLNIDLTVVGGREDGRWRLLVAEVLGHENGDPADVEILGEPLADLRGQTGGPEPPALLRALLSGGTA